MKVISYLCNILSSRVTVWAQVSLQPPLSSKCFPSSNECLRPLPDLLHTLHSTTFKPGPLLPRLWRFSAWNTAKSGQLHVLWGLLVEGVEDRSALLFAGCVSTTSLGLVSRGGFALVVAAMKAHQPFSTQNTPV
jgi:hypothetical protein